MHGRSIALASALFLAACGPSTSDKNDDVVVINATPNNANSVTTTPNNENINARDAVIVDAFNAPSDVHDTAEAGLQLTIEAVVSATIAATGGEQLVTTGTLTQSGEQFSYAADPADKLVIKWAEGAPTELYVSELNGDFAAESVDAFLGADHIVVVRVVRASLADFTVTSSKSGGTRQGAIQGQISDEDGTQFQVDMQESGTTTSDIGSTVDYESESTMSGSISAPNFELVADESYWFHSVYVDNFVVNRSRTANSRWTFDGKQYAVNDVFIRTATSNSYPTDSDYWRAEGTITEDGVVVGDVVSNEDELKIDILLRLASGETIQLDQFLKQQ